MSVLTHEPLLAEPFRLIDGLWNRLLGNGTTGWLPMLDVRETEGEYLVLVDLPGVKREDVTVETSEQTLTISGTRAPLETGDAQHCERPHGAFSRTLTLPKGVEEERIVAEHGDGVLTLRIPKPAGAKKPKKIAIGGGDRQALES
jgi:HSP20 family protein